MSNKDYYRRWLEIKEEFNRNLLEDQKLQALADNLLGLKPQSTAVEVVARIYSKYCQLYNQMCDCYDQMEQVQRRPVLRNIIDALTCRIIELKQSLELIEAFEFTYVDNALQQMLIIPQDIEILCPFFYPFEIRQAEMQYIMDEIFAGNRIGDSTPTPSQIELRLEQAREEEERLAEERELEIKKRIALGYDIEDEVIIEPTPSELEELRLKEEYETHIFNIQRMERYRFTGRALVQKKFKDENLYLELAGLKKPPARLDLRNKASELIRIILRKFMQSKRDHLHDNGVKIKLDMIISAYEKPSAKIQLEKVQETRRNFRKAYYAKWLEENVKEKARVLRVKKDDIMEDISDEIIEWLESWFTHVRVFDEYPWPEEGGTLLVVKGETQTIDEYILWKEAETKKLKAAGVPLTKEQIKAEKKAAREEAKRIALEAKEKEKKRIIDYKKSRLNPDSDPGHYVKISNYIQSLQDAWVKYENVWKYIDEQDPSLDVIRGYIKKLITEDAFMEVMIEVRPIVDELMRLEYEILKSAMKADYAAVPLPVPMTLKRKRPKVKKPLKPEKLSPKRMFQVLADAGIVRKYPRVTLDDFWGDRNYAAADYRAIPWLPKFTQPCIGDVKEQVRIRCLLTLGSSCPKINRTQLFVGPQGCGKKLLVYGVATETNALLIDLSPLNVYDKFSGPKNTKMMWQYVNKISRMMQPTVILVDKADKLFYKKVPKEEKMLDPTRLSKDFFKEIVKPIGTNDKIIVIGTASEPWLAKNKPMQKVFPTVILFPNTDYGSISFILKHTLMKYHGVDREFDVHSCAQILKGYDIRSIKNAVKNLLTAPRLAALAYKPLQPLEIVNAVLNDPEAKLTDVFDYEQFKVWYSSYSMFGKLFEEYNYMLETQYAFKLKQEKKK